MLAGVPSLYAFLLRTLAKEDISSLRLCVSGGAALPGAIRRSFKKQFGIPLIEGSGLTDSSPAAVFNPGLGIPSSEGKKAAARVR